MVFVENIPFIRTIWTIRGVFFAFFSFFRLNLHIFINFFSRNTPSTVIFSLRNIKQRLFCVWIRIFPDEQSSPLRNVRTAGYGTLTSTVPYTKSIVGEAFRLPRAGQPRPYKIRRRHLNVPKEQFMHTVQFMAKANSCRKTIHSVYRTNKVRHYGIPIKKTPFAECLYYIIQKSYMDPSRIP